VFDFSKRAKMNVFYIPSWYPDSENPVAAIFMKEQALAIGELMPYAKVYISLWEQGHKFDVKFRNLNSLSILKEYLRTKESFTKIGENVYEVYQPTLKWSSWLFKGNLKAIIKANINNFNKALKDAGKIDVIHAHVGFPAGYIASIIARKYNVPYVITEHFSYVLSDQILHKNFINDKYIESLQSADKVIAVSPSFQKRIIALGVKNTIYIPNVIDDSFFMPSIKNESNTSFVFYTLCNLLKGKGIDILLKAAHKVLQIRKNVVFHIGGDGKDKESFQRLAQELNIGGNVMWLGRLSRTDALYEYQHCDCFVLPSRYETFGIVYAEANACGKPVIATKCGGPECIVNENNGLLVDVDDIQGLANAMLQMIDEAKNYDSQKIREQFLRTFSKKIVTEELFKVYNEVSSNTYN
jgi:glycosyltransferase involved in cell wall biosynthesis